MVHEGCWVNFPTRVGNLKASIREITRQVQQAVRLGGRHNMPPPRDLDFRPFDLEVGVGVACGLGYPCAKFRLPRPFGFRVRADVRDIRQTDRRTTDADDRLMPPPPPLRGGCIINCSGESPLQVIQRFNGHRVCTRKPHDPTVIGFDLIPRCDGRTDGRTDSPAQ